MASQDETDIDVEAELDEWLRKTAAEEGLDPEALRQAELEVWDRWRKNPNPDDFEWLYNSHQPLIHAAGRRYLRSSTLPTAWVKSRMLRNYVKALERYDPGAGTQLHSYVYGRVTDHIPRDLTRYANVGRIPADRAGLIDLLQNREASLKELLGRPPSDAELADDMMLSAQDLSKLRLQKITPKEVGTLRKELRRDLLTEGDEGPVVAAGGDSFIEQQAVFLHGSLNPEQQLVLEHTYEGFGKPVVEDPAALAEIMGTSPQKVRALKKQIQKKLMRYY